MFCQMLMRCCDARAVVRVEDPLEPCAKSMWANVFGLIAPWQNVMCWMAAQSSFCPLPKVTSDNEYPARTSSPGTILMQSNVHAFVLSSGDVAVPTATYDPFILQKASGSFVGASPSTLLQPILATSMPLGSYLSS